MANERLDRIEQLQESNARAIAALTSNVNSLTNEMMDLKSSVESVLGRNAITNDMILELRAAREQDKQEFREHQAATNTALANLGAILQKLTD